MIKKVGKKKKRFGKVMMNADTGWTTKKEARNRAEELRKKFYLARVVHITNGFVVYSTR